MEAAVPLLAVVVDALEEPVTDDLQDRVAVRRTERGLLLPNLDGEPN
jgi:hypothetical protein